jgi:hypothetical protein
MGQDQSKAQEGWMLTIVNSSGIDVDIGLGGSYTKTNSGQQVQKRFQHNDIVILNAKPSGKQPGIRAAEGKQQAMLTNVNLRVTLDNTSAMLGFV